MADVPLHRHLSDALEAGYPALAVELARADLARRPATFAVLLHFGMALQELARHEEARAAYERAEAEADGAERALLWRQRGALAEAQADFGDAQHWYERAVEAEPEDTRGYVALGTMHLRRGRHEDALRALRRAVTCTEGDPGEAYLQLGLVQRAMGRYLEALECFRACLALEPDYPAAVEALADVEHVLFDFPGD